MNSKIIMFFIGLMYGTAIFAKTILVVPDCLLVQRFLNYQTLASNKNLHLITVSQQTIEKLISLENHHCNFVDVSNAWHHNIQTPKNFLKYYLAENITFHHAFIAPNSTKKIVKSIFTLMNPQNLWSNLMLLSQFKDRYADDNFGGSKYGAAAAKWLQDQIRIMIQSSDRKDVNLFTIDTYNSNGKLLAQPSIVLQIGSSKQRGTVLGAHFDTLSSIYENKPGADDNGTGTVTLLEAARVLLNSNLQYNKTIYLIWYAAEEIGKLGSQNVVQYFMDHQLKVDSVLNIDMTGYTSHPEKSIWLMLDYTNPALTYYLERLINTYIKKPIQYMTCGFPCSDNASWALNGYPVAMPFESSFNDNPNVHTAADRVETLSLIHMKDYLKLTLAFAVQTADPKLNQAI